MWQSIETLNDLIEYLEEFADMQDEDGNQIGDLPVAIAHQKNWPLAEMVSAVTVCKHGGVNRVWLAAEPSYNLGYAPRDAWVGGIEGVDWTSDDIDC